MKKIINWFRDLLYNFTDYAIILCVIVAVAAILIWRFNALFDLKIDKDTIKPVTPPIEISDNNEDTNNDENTDDSTNTDTDNDSPDSNVEDDTKNDQTDEADKNTDTTDDSSTVATGTEISFNIPDGSFPSKIADILIANGLIDDKQAFLTRSVELQLDTKLKPGNFTIKKGTSLDEIIKIIAK